MTMAQKVSYDLIIKSCEIPCSTVLIKSDLIKHRLFRQVGKEDYLLWIQILKKGVSAYNCGVVHTLYRESNTSRSGNKIRMVYQQWIILRDFEKVSLFKTLNCLLYYMARGLFKYLK